jgi:hypothetical protein
MSMQVFILSNHGCQTATYPLVRILLCVNRIFVPLYRLFADLLVKEDLWQGYTRLVPLSDLRFSSTRTVTSSNFYGKIFAFPRLKCYACLGSIAIKPRATLPLDNIKKLSSAIIQILFITLLLLTSSAGYSLRACMRNGRECY